ncbi:MAG: hypothetical protein PHH36_03175 [Sideroxydans sp.]|nr:hypothetical protein [Sideroxydans sp.]
MVFAAAAVTAVPLVEKVSRSDPEKVAKRKAVHYIENPPETDTKVHRRVNETGLPLPVPEKPPASESQPLELKGVRG